MAAKDQQVERMQTLSLVEEDERRAHKRACVLVSGQVSNPGEKQEKKVDCVILDLSASGAKVRFDEPLVSDQISKITLAGSVDFEVEVAWTSGVVAGLRFLDTPDKVASVLAGILPDGCLDF